MKTNLSLVYVCYFAVTIFRKIAGADSSPQTAVIATSKKEAEAISLWTGAQGGNTSITVRWFDPQNTEKLAVKWNFTVHIMFIEDGDVIKRTTKVPDRSIRNFGFQAFTIEDLPKCTDFRVWVTGFCRKVVYPGNGDEQARPFFPFGSYYHRYRSRTSDYRVLPEIYKTGSSKTPVFVHTGIAIPEEKINFSELKITPQKSKNGTALVHFKWKPKLSQPFGCPIQGLMIEYKTPETWPKWKEFKGGLEATISDLKLDNVYPIRVSAYNKFGAGPVTEIFFYTLPKTGPLAPIDLSATTVSCETVKLMWKPSPDETQKITFFRISYISEQGTRKASKVGPTTHGLRINLNPNMTYNISVRAWSDWGQGAPSTVIVSPSTRDSMCGHLESNVELKKVQYSSDV